MADNKTTPKSLRVSSETNTRIAVMSAQLGVSQSEVMRIAIDTLWRVGGSRSD